MAEQRQHGRYQQHRNDHVADALVPEGQAHAQVGLAMGEGGPAQPQPAAERQPHAPKPRASERLQSIHVAHVQAQGYHVIDILMCLFPFISQIYISNQG